MSKEQYNKLYKDFGKGDTWSDSGNIDGNPRRKIIEHMRESFSGPISILDIGTGKASNTKWIAEIDDESNWVGIDLLKHKDLKIPKGNTHFFIF